jgi:hypothetical protein
MGDGRPERRCAHPAEALTTACVECYNDLRAAVEKLETAVVGLMRDEEKACQERDVAILQVEGLRRALQGYYDGECHCDEEGVQRPCVGCVAKVALEATARPGRKGT